MFETVLVAHRGLLAVRTIRSCQRLGVKAVTCVAEGDEGALHARLADETIALGATEYPRSPEAVLEAARVSGAQAIHPGGGGLAEDADFARAVLAAGLIWVGASPGVPPGAPAPVPAWRETVRRLLWETGPAESSDGTGTGRAWMRGPQRLAGPDRLVEAVTGVDLVERQLRQAAGERLEDLTAGSGQALQAALYAGPQTLVPVAVSGWQAPDNEGVVVDSILAEGAWLTRYDGTLLALVTAHGRDRGQALARLTEAVDGLAVSEPPAELPALRALLREPSVVSMVG